MDYHDRIFMSLSVLQLHLYGKTEFETIGEYV